MKNNNEHVFSEEYNEKKAMILDCIEKTEKSAISKRFPVKIVLAAAVLCVILASSVLAAGVIGRQFKMNVDYLPEGVEEMVGDDYRIDIEGPPSLQYYVVDLEGEEFTHVDEYPAEIQEGMEYEIFSVNGHYAQVIHFLNWDDPEGLPEDWDEHTNKQLIVHFEDKDILVQVWASDKVSMEELKKVAEGLSFEPTEDGSMAVKLHTCD